MSTADQLALGITLGHEAHRDGISGQDNYLETRSAVTGHTEMAIRMLRDGQGLSMSANLQNDIGAYMMGQDVFNAYVDGSYDWSADYWKVLSDGNIVFDGSKNLYDENGILLKEYQGTEGFTDSLAAMLGVSFEDANKLMIDADYRWGGEKKEFVNKDGKSANLNESMKIITSGSFKASYDFQINYADQVFEKFDGSMVSAVNAYKNDINQRLELERVAGSINAKTMAGYEMLSGLSAFATQYDTTVYGTGETIIPYKTDNGLYNSELAKQFNSPEAKAAMQKVVDSIIKGNYSDNNPAYNAFNSTGILNPVDGGDTRISTYAYYDDGRSHGWGDPKSFAVDIARSELFLNQGKTIEGYPIYTNFAGRLLANSINSNNPLNLNTGNEVRLFAINKTMIYGHLLSNMDATIKLQKLASSTQTAKIWGVPLPSGLQIGNVGNSGNSTGPHLHWELYYGMSTWKNRKQ